MNEVKFPRCLRPEKASGDPDLVMFSDASEAALGACGYAVWCLENGNRECSLIAAKSKITPTKEMSIVRKELEAAVLAKRLQEFITKEMNYRFKNVTFLMDSEIVLAMLNKESYGFQTFAALRVGEIQQATKLSGWFWVEGMSNIADWITRGKKPDEIDTNSPWQVGPEFMSHPIEEWPIRQSTNVLQIPVFVTLGTVRSVPKVSSMRLFYRLIRKSIRLSVIQINRSK